MKEQVLDDAVVRHELGLPGRGEDDACGDAPPDGSAEASGIVTVPS
jgi:hypothetical protein